MKSFSIYVDGVQVFIELFLWFSSMLRLCIISWKREMSLFNDILLGTNLLGHPKVIDLQEAQ